MNNIKLKGSRFATNFVSRESYKALRTNIQFCGKAIKVIAITSCEANEGKTTITMELAKSLVEAGKKVLVIDADMRKSDIVSKYSAVKEVAGLSQYLSGEIASDEEIIYTAENEKFDIVFAGSFPSNPSELLGGEDFKKFIDKKREEYNYVLVDCPPIGMVVDAAEIASVCDGAVLVIRIGKIKHADAREAKLRIERSGCDLLGVVLNNPIRKSKKYYARYYEKKYYGKYYK